MGYASALAWILFLIIMVITFVQFRVSSRWVNYE
jgi:multiple sugar transport system permease protein